MYLCLFCCVLLSCVCHFVFDFEIFQQCNRNCERIIYVGLVNRKSNIRFILTSYLYHLLCVCALCGVCLYRHVYCVYVSTNDTQYQYTYILNSMKKMCLKATHRRLNKFHWVFLSSSHSFTHSLSLHLPRALACLFRKNNFTALLLCVCARCAWMHRMFEMYNLYI